jgi:hypothetical protein
MFTGKYETRDVLSTLWIFVTVNYIFCDVFSLHYAPMLERLLSGVAGDIEITQEFLLIFAVILELPMLMIVLSRYLKHAPNRILNIIVALFMTLIQSWSLTQGFTLHYLFFSVIEISTTLLILFVAIQWKSDK